MRNGLKWESWTRSHAEAQGRRGQSRQHSEQEESKRVLKSMALEQPIDNAEQTSPAFLEWPRQACDDVKKRLNSKWDDKDKRENEQWRAEEETGQSQKLFATP